MGNAINQDSRALWLALRNDGGWWTVWELARFWQPTFAEWEISELLQGLVAGGFVAGRDVVPGRTSYCVTSECLALPGEENHA